MDLKIQTERNVNERCREKIERVVKQLLEQDERKNGDEKRATWMRGRGVSNATMETNSTSSNVLDKGGVLSTGTFQGPDQVIHGRTPEPGMFM